MGVPKHVSLHYSLHAWSSEYNWQLHGPGIIRPHGHCNCSRSRSQLIWQSCTPALKSMACIDKLTIVDVLILHLSTGCTPGLVSFVVAVCLFPRMFLLQIFTVLIPILLTATYLALLRGLITADSQPHRDACFNNLAVRPSHHLLRCSQLKFPKIFGASSNYRNLCRCALYLSPFFSIFLTSQPHWNASGTPDHHCLLIDFRGKGKHRLCIHARGGSLALCVPCGVAWLL